MCGTATSLSFYLILSAPKSLKLTISEELDYTAEKNHSYPTVVEKKSKTMLGNMKYLDCWLMAFGELNNGVPWIP